MNIEFKDKVKDELTGFVGIVIGKCEYVTGCEQFLVQPACTAKDKTTKPTAVWFDEDRLTVTKKAKKKKAPSKLGACDPAPIK